MLGYGHTWAAALHTLQTEPTGVVQCELKLPLSDASCKCLWTLVIPRHSTHNRQSACRGTLCTIIIQGCLLAPLQSVSSVQLLRGRAS